MATGRIANIDGLRFIAAAAVVLFHFVYRGTTANEMPDLGLPPWLIGVSKYGYLGVSIFFVISGFVISYSSSGRTPIAFAIARFCRLYPTYLVAMTATFVATMLWGRGHFSTNFGQYAANLTMFSPAFGQPFMDGAYWSIVLEVVFYGWVFVLLVLGIFQKWQLPVVSAWLTIAFLLELFLEIETLRNVVLTEYAGFFAAGILFFRLHSGDRRWLVWFLLVASYSLSIATTLKGLAWLEMAYSDRFSAASAVLVVTLGYALFAVAAFSERALLRPRLLATLGALTYPVYLLHQQIGYIAFWHLNGMLPGSTQLVLVVLVVLILAWLIWYLVERPLIPWLRHKLTSLVLLTWGTLFHRLRSKPRSENA